MYLIGAIASLTCGAVLSLLSASTSTWFPRSVILLIFGSGILLMAYGWIITLFMALEAITDKEIYGTEGL
jgi:hypothetical protein